MATFDDLLSVFPLDPVKFGSVKPIARSGGTKVSSSSTRAHAQPHIKRIEVQHAWSTATEYLRERWTFSADGIEKPTTPSIVSAAIEKLSSYYNADKDEFDDLADWYASAMRGHFTTTLAPVLTTDWSKPPQRHEARRVIQTTSDRLRRAKDIYVRTALTHLTPWWYSEESDAEKYRAMLCRRLHAVFLQALPAKIFSDSLSFVMYQSAQWIFELADDQSLESTQLPASNAAESQDLLALLQDLQHVGLGDRLAQGALANAMEELMRDFVHSKWAEVDWEQQQSVAPRLRSWVANGLRPFVQSAVGIIAAPEDGLSASIFFSDTDVAQWTEKAICSLGLSRVDCLFDYVLRWPESTGAVLDLKEYVTNPAARAHLTTSFIDQMRRRLLHPGATTTQILDIYIAIIRSFTELDAKGVLLDRVARPIRRYLKARDDTAKLIVASLLAEVDDLGSSDAHQELSIEIAKEMQKPITNTQAHQGDFDWDNTGWTPNPIDADPDFKARSEDILASLLSLFDREDFINELKMIMGDHLLRNLEATEYDRETKLLELFKHRLGDDRLQACEVMLNDVQASKRMTTAIVKSESYQRTADAVADQASHPAPILDAQVLSSYFWPSLRDETFKIPPPVQSLYDEYGRGFEKLKDMRRLQWLSALGRVDVVLELEDRTIEESVPTWVASVIYAFSSDSGSESISHTVEDLEGLLEMDESLVQNGILYWIGKQVLRESASGTYTVLERLPRLDSATEAGNAATAAAAAVQAEADAAASAVKTQEDVFQENLPLYEQFVLGMLTNQGNLPSMRVWMMLKMVFPGGFTFGLEEVQGLLQKMTAEGLLVGQGDVYGIKR